jgi:hypothetical protein
VRVDAIVAHCSRQVDIDLFVGLYQLKVGS